ncbi:MAG TPA: hydroxyacid dehydrogenase [Gammaproteobacteria bacterium]|nr:hydroxyacid dehydrogenase [Gammaproteobacteria bacterium]
MADIVISEFINDSALELLSADFDVDYDPNLFEHVNELENAISDCRALIVRNRTSVTESLLDAGTSLEVVGRLGVGLDNIDLRACKARGIRVFPATGANVNSVAEYVIAALLILFRRAYTATGEVLAGEWPRNRYMGLEVSGKTLGIVGFGAIGRAVASRAIALGMRVVANDIFIDPDSGCWEKHGVEAADLKTLLGESDAVTLHVPLSEQTRHLIDDKAIAAMKKGSVVVNTARGGVIDENALVDALKKGQLGGAALDVFEKEPLPAGSHLEGAPGLLLTPHIAGVTVESNERVGTLIADRVRSALAGEH